MRRCLFCLLPLLLGAIASARDQPENWIEVRSPHFLVISNASEKQARNVADQFERMREVFRKALLRMQDDSGAPITVIAAKDEKTFRTLEPQAYLKKGQLKLGGLFFHSADKNFILLRLDAAGQHPYSMVYHEYTHFLARSVEQWLPLWLNEGLAQFYQNTTIRDKDVLLGEPSAENLYLLQTVPLLPLPTLLAVERNSPEYHEEHKGWMFYAESWALTHYLMMKDFHDRTTILSDYLELVRQEVDPVTAATRSFGDLTALQADLSNYVRQRAFNVFKMQGSVTVNSAAFKVQPLTPAQANALQADFLAYNRRDADARALLQTVLQDDPGNVLAQETMGYLEFQAGHRDQARTWYEKAVKLDSQSFLAHYYYAALTMEGAVEGNRAAQVESSLRTAIKLNPSFAPAYNQLAMFFGMRHENLQEAYTLSLMAVQLDPGNVGYRLNSANVLLASQRGTDAIAVIQNAVKVAKSPEEIARAQAALQRAEQYQAAQEAFAAQRQGAGRAGPASQEPFPAQQTTAGEEESSPPALQRRVTLPAGPRRTVTGTISDVQCSAPAAMELQLETVKGTIALHADNYYKLRFSAVDFSPNPEFKPCTDLKGKHARVEFVESSKTQPGQMISVEMRE